jgi:hypothetical protein
MDASRTTVAVALLGSFVAIIGTFLPWIQATDPTEGTTLTKAGIEGHYAMLVVALAVVAAGASVLMFWRRSAAVAIALVVLGGAQVGLEIFVGANLARGVVQLEAAGADASLGVGLYLSGLGSAGIVAAGLLAWATRSQELSRRLPGSSHASPPN